MAMQSAQIKHGSGTLGRLCVKADRTYDEKRQMPAEWLCAWAGVAPNSLVLNDAAWTLTLGPCPAGGGQMRAQLR
jgi:hypothetical protein